MITESSIDSIAPAFSAFGLGSMLLAPLRLHSRRLLSVSDSNPLNSVNAPESENRGLPATTGRLRINTDQRERTGILSASSAKSAVETDLREAADVDLFTVRCSLAAARGLDRGAAGEAGAFVNGEAW